MTKVKFEKSDLEDKNGHSFSSFESDKLDSEDDHGSKCEK